MKTIPLSQGQFAIVDDDDFHRVNRFKWYFSNNGYAVRNARVSGKLKTILMHRLISGIQTENDHKNGNKLDNRKSNLRAATRCQNRANTGPQKFRKYKGVYKHNTGFMGVIQANKKRFYLGMYATEEICARAYDIAALELHGEFAQLNFPKEEK